MKKDSRHNLIKMIAFAMVFVVILGVLGVAFTPKRSDPGSGITNSNARGFYGEPKNSIDVLILGDSNAYSACSPMYIWNRFGIPTYVAAEGFQNVTGASNLLDEVLSCQKPKLVVFDVNMLWTGKTTLKKVENNLKNLAYKYLPLAQYHNRWKSMDVKDMFGSKDYTYRSASRGQYLSMDVKPFSGQSKMVETKAVEDIPEVSKILLDKLIDKCEKNGIKIMFMETPTAKSWNYARHNAMVKYAKAKNIDFVDMNTLKGDYAIDWSTDTRDGGRHLNCKGAEKVSAYLGKYISENYSFKDKRHSEKYADWNNDYLDYVKYMSGETESLEAQQSEGTVSNN